MILRPDLINPESPTDLEIYQLTMDAGVPSSHVYMESQIFTPDSKYFVLHRSAHPHGSDKNDPRHQYLLCATESGELVPITDEIGSTAPAISPDGSLFYYFVVQTSAKGEQVSLWRRKIDGTEPLLLARIDGLIPQTHFRVSRLYPLSTISADGERLAISCFLGDGMHSGAPWGLLVFHLKSGQYNLILHGPSWFNIHPQYSRSLDPEQGHDLLIQENHGGLCGPGGEDQVLVSGLGADIHVIRDDGQHFRNLPWGRDGHEFCQGHQCWRGRSNWAITTTINGDSHHLVEGVAMPHRDHDGLLAEGARRNRLCRPLQDSSFFHFATDIKGDLLITDYYRKDRDAIYLMKLGVPGKDPILEPRFLMRPRAMPETHIHPFLSPDGKMAFFNSHESGQLQAYMIRNLPS
jgi:hypothetical protein